MVSKVELVCVVLWSGVCVMPAFGAEHTGPRVPAYERFHAADDQALAAGGRLLISELNCRSCHESGAKPVVGDKQAPILDRVGDRVRPAWIQAFLTAPQTVKPGTTMPDLLATLPDGERAATVEALTHFLASTGAVQDQQPDAAGISRGKGLFTQVGCAACHDALGDDVTPLATSVPLPDLAKKYTAGSLAAFLNDPLQVRPAGRMPHLGLPQEQTRDIAHYFLREIQLAPNVRYAAYHGSWDKLPDFATMEPVRSGTCSGFDLRVAERTDNFAVRFTTKLHLAEEGRYDFMLTSDDGSRLLIDGEEVTDADGVHPPTEVRGSRELAAGWHDLTVDFFEAGGGEELSVEIERRGLPRQSITSFVALSTDQPPGTNDETRFTVNPQLVERGRKHFRELGCANCHQLREQEQALASTRTAKRWEGLSGAGGCLAEAPVAGLPAYHFTERQRAAIAAGMSEATPQPAAGDVAHQFLATFNCYACHRRGELGGVEEARSPFFLTKQPEMGDEGRLPPALTGVGDKLRDDWLKHVLDNGANDRQQYMQAKMPRFGGANLAPLTAALIEADRQPETAPDPKFDAPDYRVKADGRHLVGGKALSCIKCHDFGEHPSQGVRALSLTTMTKRLRPDWFHRYLLDPQAYRPGTRMPAPWPFGQTTIRDVLNANVDLQIRAVWRYLADGDRAALPVGLVREPIELIATDRPILYRNFIEGAGSRAIGVGYPEKLNLAWDANNLRLAMIWHGAFIDASRHWNGRGVGFEAPLGDHVLPLPDGPPLAQLASVNDSWPNDLAREHGFRFLGYSLDREQRPTFNFRWGDVVVGDRCVPLKLAERPDPGLQRTLTFEGSIPDQAYFRVAVGGSIQPTDVPGTWLIDETWRLTLPAGVEPVVRDAQGKRELLLPLKSAGTRQVVELRYEW
jgi:mono/diheme cytochrome c family protein